MTFLPVERSDAPVEMTICPVETAALLAETRRLPFPHRRPYEKRTPIIFHNERIDSSVNVCLKELFPFPPFT